MRASSKSNKVSDSSRPNSSKSNRSDSSSNPQKTDHFLFGNI